MNDILKHKRRLEELGFCLIENVYSEVEIDKILNCIDGADSANETFRKSEEVFAIRQVVKELPALYNLIFIPSLKLILQHLFSEKYFVVKSIYFDKPASSNWYVPYHQDLTISVNRKVELENYRSWTKKHNQFAVQPPIEILENIITVRIHLDDTDSGNGALRVIPKSHLKKIYRPEKINWEKETETICEINKGGVMLMKPLTLHSSKRTMNNKKRRVIHIEFSSIELPPPLHWAERIN